MYLMSIKQTFDGVLKYGKLFTGWNTGIGIGSRHSSSLSGIKLVTQLADALCNIQ